MIDPPKFSEGKFRRVSSDLTRLSFLDMHGVYILRNKDTELYVGYSGDVKRRITEHQKGQVLSTRDKRPLELIYCELYKNRKDAMQREKFFKTGWGRRYIRKILDNTLKENKQNPKT